MVAKEERDLIIQIARDLYTTTEGASEHELLLKVYARCRIHFWLRVSAFAIWSLILILFFVPMFCFSPEWAD